MFSSLFRSLYSFGAAGCFSTHSTLYSQLSHSTPFANACAQSRSLRHRMQLFDCQLAALVPGATWNGNGWFASNDEYRSSALGLYLFQYLRSFCLRLGDLIGPHLKVEGLMYFLFSPDLLDWQTGFWSSRIKVQTSFGNIRPFHSVALLGDGAHCFTFLCSTPLHGLPSLAQQADIMAASLQALLLQTTGTNGVFAPGQQDGERDLIQMQMPVYRAPLQQTRNRSLSLFLVGPWSCKPACSLVSLCLCSVTATIESENSSWEDVTHNPLTWKNPVLFLSNNCWLKYETGKQFQFHCINQLFFPFKLCDRLSSWDYLCVYIFILEMLEREKLHWITLSELNRSLSLTGFRSLSLCVNFEC